MGAASNYWAQAQGSRRPERFARHNARRDAGEAVCGRNDSKRQQQQGVSIQGKAPPKRKAPPKKASKNKQTEVKVLGEKPSTPTPKGFDGGLLLAGELQRGTDAVLKHIQKKNFNANNPIVLSFRSAAALVVLGCS